METSGTNSFHHMMSCKNVLKMETPEVTNKRKFQTDHSDLSLSKHARFDNAAGSDDTNGRSEPDSEDSLSDMNSSSMECNNDIDMTKEESSGSCGDENMMLNHLDFIYRTQRLEELSEKDIDNILYLHDDYDDDDDDEEAKGCSNAAAYVLSSGRWTVNQDSGTIKPTIDQEFEQYFSTIKL